MGQSASANALRRKTSVGQRAREVRGLTPTRAIRLALARAAGDLWELPLSVTGIRHDLVGGDGLLQRFDGDDLLLLLDGPDGVRGGLAVDRAVLTSITEVQTIGQVTERAPASRPFTPTDAAMFAPLIDATLERVDVTLNQSDETEAACDRREAAWVLGYRFGAMVDKKSALLLAFEGEFFHVLELDIDVAAGMRQGRMIICLPDRVLRGEDRGEDEADKPQGEHAEALSSVPTKLTATLPRFQMPLSKATGLVVGDVLPMTQDALQSVILRASDGRSIARCTLGKIGDMRALRLRPKPGEKVPPAPLTEDDARFHAGVGAENDARDEQPGEDRLVPHAPADPGPVAETNAQTDADDMPDLPPLDFDEPFDMDDPLATTGLGKTGLP